MRLLKKVFEPITDTIKKTSEVSTKIMTETSPDNNKAPEKLNNQLLEIMNDRGIIAFYLLSPLPKRTKPENATHFRLVTDPNSNRVNGLLIHKTLLVTLYDNLLTFRDTD